MNDKKRKKNVNAPSIGQLHLLNDSALEWDKHCHWLESLLPVARQNSSCFPQMKVRFLLIQVPEPVSDEQWEVACPPSRLRDYHLENRVSRTWELEAVRTASTCRRGYGDAVTGRRVTGGKKPGPGKVSLTASVPRRIRGSAWATRGLSVMQTLACGRVSLGPFCPAEKFLNEAGRRFLTPKGKFLHLPALVSSSLKWGQNPGCQHSAWKNGHRPTFAFSSFMRLTGALQPKGVSRVRTLTSVILLRIECPFHRPS